MNLSVKCSKPGSKVVDKTVVARFMSRSIGMDLYFRNFLTQQLNVFKGVISLQQQIKMIRTAS